MTTEESHKANLKKTGWIFTPPKSYEGQFTTPGCIGLVSLDYSHGNSWRFEAFRSADATATSSKRAIPPLGIYLSLLYTLTPEEMAALKWEEKRCRLRSAPPKKENPTPPSVYFMQSQAGGLIKIGWAYCPKKRLHDVQLMSPVKLKILATIAGSIHDESALHQKFKHLRRYGEWFEPAPELLDFIGKAVAP